MLWNIRVYEEPADYLYERPATSKTAPVKVAEGLIDPALSEGRRQIALLTPDDDEDQDPIVVPDAVPNNKTAEELAEIVNNALREGQTFRALSYVRGALEGANGQDPELRLLAASLMEMLNFYSLAVPLFRSTLERLDGLKLAAVQIRLCDCLSELGRMEGQKEMLVSALKCQELPPGLRALGLVLLAGTQSPEEAEESLDEALDLGEEKELGDHLSVARALEAQGDLLTRDEQEKARSFYLHAGQMLARIQHPRFYALNQKLAVHHLRWKEFGDALGLSQVMFEMLDNAEAPDRARVPYLVVASRAHQALDEVKQSERAMDTAMRIDPREVSRVIAMIES